ncbi:MAG TPA: ABC transporter ATP-binding protein [Pyrinomonadaceae bacterium]
MEIGSTKNWRSGYRRLLKYPVSYWRGWSFILIVTLLTTAFSLLQPLPMKILVDHVFDRKPVSEGIKTVLDWIPWTESAAGLLFWVAAAGLLIFAVNSTLDLILTFSWIRVGQKMVYDLTCDIFAHVQRRSLIFHTRNSVGDLMSRITGDSWCIHTITDTLLFAPGHALVTIIAMVFVMTQINLELTLMALAVAPLMTAASLFFGKKIRKVARQKRDSESRIQSHVQQTLSGIVVVKAFAQEEREHDRFREFARAAIGAHKRSTLTGSFYNLLSGGFNSLGNGLILYFGAHYVISGKLTIGSLLVFISYLGTLQGQLKSFTGIYSALQNAGASVDRVMEVLAAEQEVKNNPDARPLTNVQGHVRFENITFGYEENQPILRDVSFEALPGQTVAIVGHTGAGKSTLVSLVPRFFDAWTGTVKIDNRDVREIELKSLRSQIGIVLQEPFLFPLSIAENIAYGRPNANRAEIEAAAVDANAHEFIEQLPEGYNTIIGERGATLSGGERQRLSIARALLKNAPVLILDEPTSALDARTESLLLEALERLMNNRTTFIIAHRLSTIRKADQILVLDKGKIVESGNYDELLAKKGVFESLHKLQFVKQQNVNEEA